MVEEGPWEPVDQSDDPEPEATDDGSEGRGFWDYALVGVVLVLLAVVGATVVSSQTSSTPWTLDVRIEQGEHSEPTVITENDTVLFDAAVGFAGDANGDVVENVSVRAIGQDGNTIARTCLGTLRNDAEHRLQLVQFELTQEPARVVIQATGVRSDSGDYLVRGWSREGGVMGGGSTFVQNRSTFIDPTACQS